MNRVEYDNTLFPEFMYCRISALHNTLMKYPEKNFELSLLLKYRSWTRDEIHAHFYSIEYMSNLHLCIDKNEISTKYDHVDSYFYLQFLGLIAGDEPLYTAMWSSTLKIRVRNWSRNCVRSRGSRSNRL